MSKITYEYFFPFIGPEEVREYSEAGDNEEIDFLDYFKQTHKSKSDDFQDLFNQHYDYIESISHEQRINMLLAEKEELEDRLASKERECSYWQQKHALRASYISELEKKIESLEFRLENDSNLINSLQQRLGDLESIQRDKDAWEAQKGLYIDPMQEKAIREELETALQDSQLKLREVRNTLIDQFTRKQAEFEKVLDSLSSRLRMSEERVEELNNLLDVKENTIRDLVGKIGEKIENESQMKFLEESCWNKSFVELDSLRVSLKLALEQVEKGKDCEQRETFLESCIATLVEENDKLTKALSREQKFREQVLILANQEK